MEGIELSAKGSCLFHKSASLSRIASGYYFTEGPVWDSEINGLYFTNFSDNTIHLWKETTGAEVYRSNSGRAVGLSLTADGRLLCAETQSHAITCGTDRDVSILAGNYKGKMLNSPNDVVARSDGAVFFTDPYSTAMGDVREIPFNGFYCIPVRGTALSGEDLILLDDRMERPNGLAFSPDESILYVNDTNKQWILAYHMREDNTASYIGVFARLDPSFGPGCADGMKVDVEGNVYVTGPGGIWIIDSSGIPAAILRTPENAGNLCFGGTGNRTLFITASTGVYKTELNIPGIIPVRHSDLLED